MTKKLNLILELLLFAFLLCVSLLLALGNGFTGAVQSGINLWAACVLPSLFPYFFITTTLSALKVTGKLSNKLSPLTLRLFNQNGAAGYAFLISVISGYPVGAKTVADLKNKGLLTDAQAVRASALCSTSSPMFLISSVGTIMFNDRSFGLKLFAVHIISAVITGCLFSFYKRKEPNISSKFVADKIDNLLYQSAYSAVISVLVVGSLITVFYLLTEILHALGFFVIPVKILTFIFKDERTAKAVIYGAFECTRALKELSLGGKSLLSLPVAALICGFGGLSVIAQSVAYLKGAKIKTTPFILAKIIMAVIGFLVGLIFSLF